MSVRCLTQFVQIVWGLRHLLVKSKTVKTSDLTHKLQPPECGRHKHGESVQEESITPEAGGFKTSCSGVVASVLSCLLAANRHLVCVSVCGQCADLPFEQD